MTTSNEQLFVLKSGKTIPTSAARRDDVNTGSINLGIDTFGLYTLVAGSGNPTVLTAANAASASTAKDLQMHYRLDVSKLKSPLPQYELQSTDSILLDGVSGLQWAGTKASLPTENAWVLGGREADTLGTFNFDSELQYTMQVVAEGQRNEMYYGKGYPIKEVYYTTPNFDSGTFSYLNTQHERRDYVLSNIIKQYNEKQFNTGDALAAGLTIATTNANAQGATVHTVTSLTAAAVGSSIIIGYNNDGTAILLKLTVGRKQALLAMLNAINAKYSITTACIVAYALPSSQNITTLTATGVAGANGNLARIDMIGFVALEIDTAYFDEMYGTKRNIHIGLGSNFSELINKIEVSPATEGEGTSRQIELIWQNQGYRRYALAGKAWEADRVSFPSPVVDGGYYDVYVLNYSSNRITSNAGLYVAPKSVIVAIPNFTVGDATTNAFYTGTTNTQKTTFEAVLNAYLGRAGVAAVTL